MKHSSPEKISRLLREHGLKVTSERQEILAALFGARHPLTILQIQSAIKHISIDQATVYRTMGRLVEKGIVRSVDFHHGHMHYELADAQDHHHLVCTQCGVVEDIQGCVADIYAQEALKLSSRFLKVTGHSLELFGICKKCHNNKK